MTAPKQAAAGGAPVYTESRADGWPLCPRCGEDELWSAGDETDQSFKPTIESIAGCYMCGWEPIKREWSVPEVPLAVLREAAMREGRTLVPVIRVSPKQAATAVSPPTEREIAAAYAQDRSEQYTDKSSAKCALEDLAAALRGGEHMAAFEHGELDDLIAWARKRRRK
jgi:hypothetical protein